MKLLSLSALLLASLSLISCAGTHKEAAPPLMSQKMAKRFTSKPDPNKRSIYDKDMKASLDAKKGGTAFLSRQKYGTKKYTGSKEFKSHTPDYKTKEFTSGKDKTHMGEKKFTQADKKPSYADQSFNTKKSWFGKRTAHDGSKTFHDSTDVFKTSANHAALKSQEKNKRPQIIELENKKGDGQSAYSEEQVKKLIGRD